MPKPKLMVKRTSIEVAKGKRTCAYSGEEIQKDAVCLVLLEDARDRYVYCKDVALRMIEMARERLAKLEGAIKNGAPLE
jgi:hypothetical protein